MSINGLPLFPSIFSGSLTGDKHWKLVEFETSHNDVGHVYGGPTDFSDGRVVGEGETQEIHYPMYFTKPCSNSFTISLACLALPALITFFILQQFPVISTLPNWAQYTIIGIGCSSYLALSIAYNAARIGAIAIYLIGHFFYDVIKNKKGVLETLKSHALEFLKQTALSLINMVRGPFYALLYNIGHLYTLVSPLNGRKFCAQVERAWNHGIPLIKSFSAAGCCEDQATLEGNGKFEELGKSSFYLARCYQPQAYVVCDKDGKIKRVDSAVLKSRTFTTVRPSRPYPKTFKYVPAGC